MSTAGSDPAAGGDPGGPGGPGGSAAGDGVSRRSSGAASTGAAAAAPPPAGAVQTPPEPQPLIPRSSMTSSGATPAPVGREASLISLGLGPAQGRQMSLRTHGAQMPLPTADSDTASTPPSARQLSLSVGPLFSAGGLPGRQVSGAAALLGRQVSHFSHSEDGPPPPLPQSAHNPVLGLSLSVFSAADLVSADIGGSSDPYVVASLHWPDEPPREVGRTEHAKGTLNPVWNAQIPQGLDNWVPMRSPPATLRLAVFDYDRFSADDFLGMAEVSLFELRRARRLGAQTLTLEPGAGGQHPGQDKLSAEWRSRGPGRGLGKLKVVWFFRGLPGYDYALRWRRKVRVNRTTEAATAAALLVGAYLALVHEPDHVVAYLSQIGARPFKLFPYGEDSFGELREIVPGADIDEVLLEDREAEVEHDAADGAEAAASPARSRGDMAQSDVERVAERWGEEYAGQVEREFHEEAVDVGEVVPEVVEHEQEHIDRLQELEDRKWGELAELRQEELRLREQEARDRVLAARRQNRDALAELMVRTRETELQARNMVQRMWKRGEDSLLTATRRRRGQLEHYHDKTQDVKTGRRWIAEWLKAPQPILLTLHALRGTRSKLSEGYYVVHAGVYDVLAGQPISYIARAEDECQGNTKPHRYLGKFYTAELTVGETLRMVCPSAALLRSHAVLQFEVWQLKQQNRSRYQPTDRIVGWGAWPLVVADFSVRHGKWKVPLLKGTPDHSVDTFHQMQHLIESDLHNWLGNLYFTIEPDYERMARPAIRVETVKVLEGKEDAEEEQGLEMKASFVAFGSEESKTEGGDANAPGIVATAPGESDPQFDTAAWGADLHRDSADSREQGQEKQGEAEDGIAAVVSEEIAPGTSEDAVEAVVSLEVPAPAEASEDPFAAVSLAVPAPARAAVGFAPDQGRDSAESAPQRVSDDKGSKQSGEGPKPLPGPKRGLLLTGDQERTGELSMHGVPAIPKVSFFGDLAPSISLYDSARMSRKKRAPKADDTAKETADVEDILVEFDDEFGSDAGAADNTQYPEDRAATAVTAESAEFDMFSDAGRQDAWAPEQEQGRSSKKSKRTAGEKGVPIMSRTKGKGLSWKARLDRLQHSNDLQVISRKMRDWEILDQLDKEAERADNEGIELDAGDYDPQQQDDAVPKGRMSTARRGITAVGLGKIARRLNVLKKMAKTGTRVEGPSVDPKEFFCSVSGRRDFFFMPKQFRDKMPFLISVMYYDMGINPTGRWEKNRTALAVICFVLMAHARTYIHYFGLWVFLSAKFVPFERNEWTPWSVDIRFNHGHDSIFAVSTSWMVIATAAGTMMCIGFQVFCIVSTIFIHWIFGFFPYSVSRFLMWYCVAAALDPFLTLLLDVFKANWYNGEAFLLFQLFARQEGSGLAGVLTTGAVYFILFGIASFLAYWYMVAYHLDGRINDIYTRVQSPESSFWMPYDCEVSKTERDEILYSAKRWRSDSGEVKRAVAEDIDDYEVCCFRERLWVLLDLQNDPEFADADVEKWLQEYLARITLARPKRSAIRHNLASQKIGADILDHLMRTYPFLTTRDRYHTTSRKDQYYDNEFQALKSQATPLQQDLREQRVLLMRYFSPQVRKFPCRWIIDPIHDLDSDDSLLLGQRDPGDLADQLYIAMKGLGTDEDLIWRTLDKVESSDAWHDVKKAFKRRHADYCGGDLLKALADELSASEMAKAKGILSLNGVVWDDRVPVLVDMLYEAMEGLGTDEAAIYVALEGITSQALWNDVVQLFLRLYPDFCGGDLRRALRDELSHKELARARGILTKNHVVWDDKEGGGNEGDAMIAVDPFKVTDLQLLADLVFFETSGAAKRREYVHEYLGSELKEGMRRKLQWFRRCDRGSSVAVNPIRAGFLTLYITNARTGERELFRAFVQMPNGALIESVPGSFEYDPQRHTTDDPEYWQHRTLIRHAD
eukprot:TRINITY_DN23414_c0_g1_i1.p1 TRINITY_DN23414_c0_g1~~TRINITY_DN23414_c0_g1_i1.p1  ORF type:complete len:1935 (+),score=647.67 TRINITY_DN23414_c0_g1_i1:95-5899(+)